MRVKQPFYWFEIKRHLRDARKGLNFEGCQGSDLHTLPLIGNGHIKDRALSKMYGNLSIEDI